MEPYLPGSLPGRHLGREELEPEAVEADEAEGVEGDLAWALAVGEWSTAS